MTGTQHIGLNRFQAKSPLVYSDGSSLPSGKSVF